MYLKTVPAQETTVSSRPAPRILRPRSLNDCTMALRLPMILFALLRNEDQVAGGTLELVTLVLRVYFRLLPDGLHSLLLNLFRVARAVVVRLQHTRTIVSTPTEEAIMLAQRRFKPVYNHFMIFRRLEKTTEGKFSCLSREELRLTIHCCTSCFSRTVCVMKTKLHCLQIGNDVDLDDSFCSEEEVSSTVSAFPGSPSAPEVESLFWSPEEVTSLTPKEAFDVSSSLSTLGLSS